MKQAMRDLRELYGKEVDSDEAIPDLSATEDHD